MDHTVDGKLKLSWWDHTKGSFGAEVFVVEIDASELLEWLPQLTNMVSIVMQDALTDVATGDCERCANVRLIQDPTKEREWRIRCPECGPRQTDLRSWLRERPRLKRLGLRQR